MSTATKRQRIKVRVMAPQNKEAAAILLAAPPQTPTYTQAGSTEHFKISFDDTLGTEGMNLANAMLMTCERDYARLKEYFGTDADDLPFVVQIIPGGAGAFHSGTAISVYDVPGTSDDLGRLLLLAEVDESFMEAQDAGWDDGGSNGEGLSRVLATEPYPDSLGVFASATTWLDNGRPDWVTKTENTDGNFISIGCSVLFLYFLRFQLGYSWKQIVLAGGSTLAETYKNLTGRDNGLQRFEELIQRRFPQVPRADPFQDNPFPLQSDILAYDPATGDKSIYLADAQGSRPRKLPKTYDGWRSSWSMIVAGNFGGNGYSDLLFYDPLAGVGEFYLADGTGNLHLLNTNENWNTDWSSILAGKFMNSGYSSLFFYEASTGKSRFATTDGSGKLNMGPVLTTQNPTRWTKVITGNFTNSGYDDLLFYDATTGKAALYTADGTGSMILQQEYEGWRTTWKLIVAGKFTGANRDDLLFYDPTTGEGEFRSIDNNLEVPLVQGYSGWRTTWSAIVPGNFVNGNRTSLLFYDPVTGDAELNALSGQADMSEVKTNNWRKTLSLLVPGNFRGNSLSEVLLYDAAAGAGEIWNTNGRGDFGVLKSFGGRRTTWTKVIPGNFTGGDFNDVLLYDAGAGAGEFYSTDGQGNLGFPLQAYSNWRKSWDQIVAGRFTDDKYDSLLFYDQAAGTGEFYTTDGKGNMKLLSSYTGWRTSWTMIVAGKFTHSEYTDLLFYEGSTGDTVLYTADGTGGMTLVTLPSLPVNFGAGWQKMVVGNFTGRPLQDLLLYRLNPHLLGSGGILLTTDGKGNFTQKNSYSSMFQLWSQISRGNFGGAVFSDSNGLVQFSKIDESGAFVPQQSYGGVFPPTAILTAGAFS